MFRRCLYLTEFVYDDLWETPAQFVSWNGFTRRLRGTRECFSGLQSD